MPRLPIEFFSGPSLTAQMPRVNPHTLDANYAALNSVARGIGDVGDTLGGYAARALQHERQVEKLAQNAQNNQLLSKLEVDSHTELENLSSSLQTAQDVGKWKVDSAKKFANLFADKIPANLDDAEKAKWETATYKFREEGLRQLNHLATQQTIKRAADVFSANWENYIKDYSRGFVSLEDVKEKTEQAVRDGLLTPEMAKIKMEHFVSDSSKYRAKLSISTDAYGSYNTLSDLTKAKEAYPSLDDAEIAMLRNEALVEWHRNSVVNAEKLCKDILNQKYPTDYELLSMVNAGTLTSKEAESLMEKTRAAVMALPDEREKREGYAKRMILEYQPGKTPAEDFENRKRVYVAIAALREGAVGQSLLRDFNDMKDGKGIWTHEFGDVSATVKKLHTDGLLGIPYKEEKEEFAETTQRGVKKQVSLGKKTVIDERKKAESEKRAMTLLDLLSAEVRANPKMTREQLMARRDVLLADIILQTQTPQIPQQEPPKK